MSVRDSDKTKPYFPLAGLTNDGYNEGGEATATCYCGAVQLAFPTSEPGFVKGANHVCNCTDCRKVHSSMFGANFVVLDSHLKHLRGREHLTEFGQDKTPTTGRRMANYFCNICGTIMYRIGAGFPGQSILRVGTVDDYNLQGTLLKPDVEQFVKDRCDWVHGLDDVRQVDDFAFKDSSS